MDINGEKHVSRLSKTRPSIDAQAPLNRTLDADFWLQFSEDPNPANRQKMVYVTIDDVSRVGPSTFNAIAVCDVLEVSYSLVNFHFGSRDELLAEAAALVYQYHITDLWKQVQAAKANPEARLRAWIEATVNSFNRMGGWGSVINYPTASLQITELVQNRYGTLMNDLAELNLARLLSLVMDVKKKKVSSSEYELGNLPRALLLKDPKMVALAASVGFSTLGMAVWSSGRQQDSAKINEDDAALAKTVMASHIKRIIDQI
jgi:AcrR family transcriptional regulator